MGSNKLFKNVTLGFAGVIVLSLLMPAMASPAAIEWKMQTIYPAGDSTTPCHVDKIVKALNAKLSGKLHVTLYMPGQIVPEEQMFEALKRGVYDVGFMAPTWYQSFIPDAMVGFGLPLGWPNYDMDMEFFYKYGFLKYMRDIHAEQNVHYLGPANMGAVGLIGSFPFRKLEDIKGKKLWCIGTVAAFVRNLGGTPVTFPLSELYMALKLGTLDGAVPGFGDLDSAGYKEVIKYVNYPPFLDPNASILVGMNSWKKLSPDVQKAVEDTLMEIHPAMNKCIDDYTVNAIEASKKLGVQVITMDPVEVQKLRPSALKVWDEIAGRSPRAPKTVQMLKDFLATKGIKLK